MASNTLLVAAASGLEPIMSGTNKAGIIKQSITAQVSAAIFYEATVISNLNTSKTFENLFKKVLFDQIQNDFSSYIDSQARVKPKSLQHVYEWSKQGQPEARLFKLDKMFSDGLNLTFSYSFKKSKESVTNKYSKRKYVFANKAEVMEEGIPVVIAPKYAERIVFDTGAGYTVYMPKGASVAVRSPGGVAAKQSFQIEFKRFFTGQLVSESIKRSGFQKIFDAKMQKALKLPTAVKKIKYSFSPNSLRVEADAALEKAFGGL